MKPSTAAKANLCRVSRRPLRMGLPAYAVAYLDSGSRPVPELSDVFINDAPASPALGIILKYESLTALALLLKSHILELFAVVTGIVKARWTVRKVAVVAFQICRGKIKEGALPAARRLCSDRARARRSGRVCDRSWTVHCLISECILT